MRIGAIVQARMSSARLPGKVLRDLCGRPMLGYLLDRLARAATLADVVVATSTNASDDAIERFCRDEARVPCVRGPLEDVAGRFVGVLDRRPLDAFVRICADSPLLDQRIVDAAVRLFSQGAADMVTNKTPKRFPSGQSVEVVDASVFRTAYGSMTRADEREHVTLCFYDQPGRWRVRSLEGLTDLGAVHMAVDTEADFDRAAAMIGAMTHPHWEYSLDDLMDLRSATGAGLSR